MTNEKQVAIRNEYETMALPDGDTFKQQIEAINRFQQIVRACMVEGQDFGVIPGTSKPTLLKPGAEKITKLLGLSDQYEIAVSTEDWNKPLFRYLIRCRLVSVRTGVLISEGLGECNSMEAKYRWRDAKRKCPECGKEAIIKGKREFGSGWLCYKNMGGCGYKWPDGAEAIEGQVIGKIENDDIYSLVNTILKMAEKRALVDAALHAGRLSQVFTQDIEDMPEPSAAPVVEMKKATKPNSPPPVAPPVATEPPARVEGQIEPEQSVAHRVTVRDIYQAVREGTRNPRWIDKTVEGWLETVLRIDLAQLETEPEKVIIMVKEKCATK